MKTSSFSRSVSCLILTALLGGVAAPAQANTLTNVRAFQTGDLADGWTPEGGLTLANDGNVYGVTYSAGAASAGTLYSLSPKGAFSTILSFAVTYAPSGGGAPRAALTLGPDGNLYGSTTLGGAQGYGMLFRYTPGMYSLRYLHSFIGTDGKSPSTALEVGPDGNLYGTTASGGAANAGVAFMITPIGDFKLLYSFDGVSAAMPQGLTLGPDGNFYGLASSTADGTGNTLLFRLTPAGVFSEVYGFDKNLGNGYYGQMTRGHDGNLYGVTAAGGTSNCGMAFSLSPAGVVSTIHSFSGPDGCGPFGRLTQGSDGTLYGATIQGGSANVGSVFSMTPQGDVTTLYSFSGGNDSELPVAGVSFGSDGALYGITSAGGGPYDNWCGIAFKLALDGSIPPGAVGGLTASVADSQTTLKWNAADGATSYNLFEGTAPGAESIQPIMTGITGTSVNLTRLTDGTPYYFKVVAANTAGAGPISPEASVTPVAPPSFWTPTAVAGNHQVTLSWQSTQPVDSYTVYMSTTPSGGSAVATGLTTTTYTVTGLTNGTTYYFWINGTNAGGTGGSPVVSATPVYGTLPAPVFNPASGTYTGPLQVTISDASPKAKIYYTVDGTVPTSSSYLYTAPITLKTSRKINAIAIESGFISSKVSAAAYRVSQ